MSFYFFFSFSVFLFSNLPPPVSNYFPFFFPFSAFLYIFSLLFLILCLSVCLFHSFSYSMSYSLLSFCSLILCPPLYLFSSFLSLFLFPSFSHSLFSFFSIILFLTLFLFPSFSHSIYFSTSFSLLPSLYFLLFLHLGITTIFSLILNFGELYCQDKFLHGEIIFFMVRYSEITMH
ncbi:unnamed protein product [Acanthosepion pharaonis]|uniref:Uncharacterized protein n=1 Tax=Acanthosepion pharaonis TaxID=158019 RepID=A0A812E2Q9_ACAPH|nr:unnamed protein product [Sepia pharaonis]